MTHYDHATAMTFKLGRWSEDRPLKNYELEAIALQQRTTVKRVNKQSFFKRCSTVLVNPSVALNFESRSL